VYDLATEKPANERELEMISDAEVERQEHSVSTICPISTAVSHYSVSRYNSARSEPSRSNVFLTLQ